MHISHYNSLIYVFVSIIAIAGMYLSRTTEGGQSGYFNGGKPLFWVISALSIFASSLFQFWTLLLPILSLSLSSILVILSLIVSIVLPILFVKNRTESFHRFFDLFPAKLKTAFVVVIIVFFLIIQPFALLFLGEKIIAQFLGGSYHFLLVFLISVAGLCAMIGGKRVVVYANAMFGISIIASLAVIIILGRSLSAPLLFLQTFYLDGTQYFQYHNFIETNWIVAFIGFSVITWWMWWIDNSAIHVQDKQTEQRSFNTALFTSFILIVTALVVLPLQGFGETSVLNSSPPASPFMTNELTSFFFVLGCVSIIVSAFSHSYQSIAVLVIAQFFDKNFQEHVEEKHVLVARLVIVLSALLTILYIPFAQFFGALTLLVYVQYLCCFAASLMGAFTVFVFWKNLYRRGITAGIIGGVSAGIILLFLLYTDLEIVTPLIKTPYGAATGVFFFSIVCSIGGSIIWERKVSKNSVVV